MNTSTETITSTEAVTDTKAKRNIIKLQRAIVDGLEDVKAQDIQVFNTEHLSSLFERVIIASGTSNRQTKALAASVRDAVRDAKFPKPRMEGESNGEWIIVDCGAAVVHIMQPTFRQYYKLEELWGGKPVRLKLGAAKPVVAKAESTEKSTKSPKPSKAEKEPNLRRSSAAKKGVEEAFPSRAALKKAADATAAKKKKAAAQSASGSASDKPVKTVVVAASKRAVRATAAKKAA